MRQGLNKRENEQLKEYLKKNPRAAVKKAAEVFRVASGWVEKIKKEVAEEKKAEAAYLKEQSEELFESIKPHIEKLIDSKIKGPQKKG